jgi:hypothetical protein
MAINFPTSLDNFTNPVSGNTLDSPSHSLQHSDINDAVEAMQRKVGVGTAVAGSASAGQVLTISAAGTSTWSTPSASGLTQVVPTSVAVGSGSGSVDANGAVTFSGASSVSLNECFTSAYDNYKLVCKITSSATIVDLSLRLRAGVTDNSSANYWFSSSLTTAGATTYIVTSGTSTASTSFRLSPVGSTYQSKHAIDILNPFSTDQTGYLADAFFWSGTSDYGRTVNGGVMTVTNSYNGLTLFPASGTITGTIRVYGYKN